MQAPVALHVSSPLQTFESEQGVPAATNTCVTPDTGSQLSVVHGFPSVIENRGRLQTPAPSQVSTPLQASPSEQDVPAARMTPGMQVPFASQSSLPLHGLKSEQDEPTGAVGLEHVPLVRSQEPGTWHASSAAQMMGADPMHVPASHVSVCVQGSPSSQKKPSGVLS
jgi:hypothetical protein